MYMSYKRYQFCLCLLQILSNLEAIQLIFEQGLFIRITVVSFTSCKSECDIRQKCSFLKYNRLNKLCELYDTGHLANTYPGFYIYSKVLYLHQTDQYRAICDGCTTEQDCCIDTSLQTASCITESCGIPVNLDGLTKYGNVATVSSRVNYICDTPPHEKYTTVCEGNGQWSNATFNCICRPPSIDHAESASWDYFNSTHVTSLHVCLPGYEIRYVGTPLCNFETGEQTSFGATNACCDVATRDGWIKVFRYPASIAKRSIFYVWSTPDRLVNGAGSRCRYGNNAVLDNWESFNIQRVKVDIIKNDTIVAYIIFDGTGSSYLDWFTGCRLLESSWSDLTSQSAPDVDIFSINGASDVTGPNSFLIADSVNNNCSGDVGWLLITSSAMPYDCSTEFEGTDDWIVYALHNKAGIFSGNDSSVGYADIIEIWVEY